MTTSSTTSGSRPGAAAKARPEAARFTIEPAARKRLRQWLLCLIGVFALLVIGEEAFRILRFGWGSLASPVEYSATRLDRFGLRWDEAQMNTLPVNYRGRNLGAVFTTGSLGFRMADRPFAKPPGTLRVGIIGYSIDLGHGVGDDETYAMRLQRMADEAARVGRLPPVEFLNFSSIGRQTRRQRRVYETYGVQFDLDAVMLPLYPDAPVYPKPAAKPPRPQQQVADSIETTFLGDFYLTYGRQYLRRRATRFLGWPNWSRPGPERLRDPVAIARGLIEAELVRRIRSDGRAVIIMPLLRPLHGVATDADRAVIAAVAAEFADDPCIRVLDTLPGLDGKITPDETVMPWDNHPDAEVHALYADTLFPLLLPMLVDPGACRAAHPA